MPVQLEQKVHAFTVKTHLSIFRPDPSDFSVNVHVAELLQLVGKLCPFPSLLSPCRPHGNPVLQAEDPCKCAR